MRTIVKSSNILYSSFTMIPNALFKYQRELKLTDNNLLFIIKLLSHKDTFKLHDSLLGDKSNKTYQRRRQELRDLELIDYKVYSHKKDDKYITDGIIYDITKLEEKMIKLLTKENTIEKEVEKALESTSKPLKENTIADPVDKFKQDWYNEYGTEYTITDNERNVLRTLSENQVNALGYIFEWISLQKNLPKKFMPRLSFFFKTKFRFKSLCDYYNNQNDKFEDELLPEENINFEEPEDTNFVSMRELLKKEEIEELGDLEDC